MSPKQQGRKECSYKGRNSTKGVILLRKEEQDPRIIRTRALIRAAFITHLEEKGFEAMTVRDLTETAMINRATFYKHYKDKYDLLDKLMEEMLEGLKEAAPNHLRELVPDDSEPAKVFVRLFQFIEAHHDFFRVMLGKKGLPIFQHQILDMLRKYFNERFETMHPSPANMKVTKDVLIAYLSSAHLGVIMDWLEKGRPYSKEYMAKQLSLLTVLGPLNAAGIIED
jgi:AcrR family transcriptional regulator